MIAGFINQQSWAERWLVDWFNRNAAGGCKRAADGTFSDTGLVVQAFSLRDLARDLSVCFPPQRQEPKAAPKQRRKSKRRRKR